MRKQLLICVLSFVVPFFICGIGAWLWTEGTSDRPHGVLASDKEIADAERQIDTESNNKFLVVGSSAGLAGVLLASGALFLYGRIRRIK